MADEADIAQVHEEAFRAESIRRAKCETPSIPARRYCENCGERIPEARRRAVPGTHFCTECKSRFERRCA